MRVTTGAWIVAGGLLLVGCGGSTLPSDEAPGLPLGWLSYSDDGTLVAASRWRVVRLDPQLNEIDRTVPPYPFEGDIQGLTFFGVSHDGRVAAYGWQADTYRQGPPTIDPGAIVFEAGHNGTMAVAVSADGSTVASSCTVDGGPDVIAMWRLPDGAPLRTVAWPADLGGLPVSLALSPHGDRVAATVVPGGPQNDSLVVWEGERLLYRRDGETDWAVAFSPDGATLAVANAKQGVRLLRASDGAVIAQHRVLADSL